MLLGPLQNIRLHRRKSGDVVSAEYIKPDWCEESTWSRAKELVFKLVPESLMARTGQRRIELAAKALQEERNEK